MYVCIYSSHMYCILFERSSFSASFDTLCDHIRLGDHV